MGRTEAVEYCGFRVIKIWELQNDLAAGWPSVPSAHMSGLHAARHAQIRPAAGNLASKRALGIYRVSRSTLVAELRMYLCANLCRRSSLLSSQSRR